MIKKNITYLTIFFLLFNCKKVEEKNYDKYFDYDKVSKTEAYYKSKEKAKIPFIYNRIYDPFLKQNENRNNPKLTFENGIQNTIKLIVIDSVETSITVTQRKKKQKIVKGIPVIIENISENDTVHFPIFRGGVLLIQEAKNKKNEWVEIERIGSGKLGHSFYKIYPENFIYTKIIKYNGNFETQLRTKLRLNDSTVIYSNTYSGKIKKWLVR